VMRTVRVLSMAVAVVALLVAAGCSASSTTSTATTAEATSTPTTSPVPTEPVGPMQGSNATTMPSVVGLNLRIAAERFVGIGQGARLFTDKYHGVWARDVYSKAGGMADIGDPVVTISMPKPGTALHGDNIYLGTGPLEPRKVKGQTVGPWFFNHGALVRKVNDQGCWGCHPPEYCQRCHPGYKVGTAGLAHPPVTVESVVRKRIDALYPDKKVVVTKVLVSGTDGYAVYLTYAEPTSATSAQRTATEGKLTAAIAEAKLKGVSTLVVIWTDQAGRVAATDKVPLR
jgi:hypothetical protein